jgi:hypothetical protein
MRLDEDKLDALRRWGQALRQADGEESAAAGRAILMLIEQIDSLRLELCRTREQMSREDPVSSADAGDHLGPEEPSTTLHQRLQRFRRRDPAPLSASSPEPVEAGESDMESDGTEASSQAWIESLRRQT